MPNQQEPLISICIPTYKNHRYSKFAIQSAVEQDYTNFEVIVNDESAGRELQSVVDSLRSDKIRYRHVPHLNGLIKKLNDFLQTAKGDWMLILCDDDLLDKDYLRTLASHIGKHPGATLIRSRYKLIDTNGNLIRLDRIGKYFMNSFEFLSELFLPEKQNFKMNITGIMFKRQFLHNCGGFKDYYKAWHIDRLAWAQLASMGSCICDDKALCSIRLHPASATSSLEANYMAELGTTLNMKEAVENVLNEMSQEARTEEDRKLLELTRQRFRLFLRRHLSRSLDHGLMSILQKDNQKTSQEVKTVLASLKELNLPKFRSLLVYEILAPFPHRIRMPFLKILRAYKLKNLTS